MISIPNLFPKTVEVLVNALKLSRSKVVEYYDRLKGSLDEPYREPLDTEMKKELEYIDNIIGFVSGDSGIGWIVDPKPYEKMYSTIRSALDIYIKDLEATKQKTQSKAFDSLIEEAKAALTLEGLKNAKGGQFDKYYSPPAVREKLEFFISYSTRDKEIAGKVEQLLKKMNVDVFLAHEKIEVSAVWREEILRHLKSCSALVCIVTKNFLESEWTGQEAGFVLGREKNVISLVFPGVKLPGFLESIQAQPTKEETLENDIKEPIESIIRKLSQTK